MSTDNKYGFMYLGTTKEEANGDNSLKVPFPDQPSADFESEWGFDGNRNGNNVLVGQFTGRQNDKQNSAWSLIPAETWWELNRFRLATRNSFFCKYFNHNLGYWFTRKFYTGNPKVGLLIIDEKTGKPVECYNTASLNFIDTGEGD